MDVWLADWLHLMPLLPQLPLYCAGGKPGCSQLPPPPQPSRYPHPPALPRPCPKRPTRTIPCAGMEAPSPQFRAAVRSRPQQRVLELRPLPLSQLGTRTPVVIAAPKAAEAGAAAGRGGGKRRFFSFFLLHPRVLGASYETRGRDLSVFPGQEKKKKGRGGKRESGGDGGEREERRKCKFLNE